MSSASIISLVMAAFAVASVVCGLVAMLDPHAHVREHADFFQRQFFGTAAVLFGPFCAVLAVIA